MWFSFASISILGTGNAFICLSEQRGASPCASFSSQGARGDAWLPAPCWFVWSKSFYHIGKRKEHSRETAKARKLPFSQLRRKRCGISERINWEILCVLDDVFHAFEMSSWFLWFYMDLMFIHYPSTYLSCPLTLPWQCDQLLWKVTGFCLLFSFQCDKSLY